MKNPLNLLQHETSPYLLQHADNPVNWHPWNQQSLELAKAQNKPILLSIGYSACHWCHVMAHESFEDPATAEIMNQHFINIKVDREERPDLDKIYQTAHSLLTSRSGGWPLTVFLSPENQMPFFAGTYFPDSRRYNMPSFSEIMLQIADAYVSKKTEIEEQNISIAQVLNNMSKHNPTDKALNALPLDLARKQLESAFDPVSGGFTKAPKFPHADMLERCLRHYHLLKSQGKPDKRAYEMAIFSLDKMALGGFQDQIGGGFYRYSTDDNWMIPHFEKMLYDNAQLFALYAQAYTLTHSLLYKNTIKLAAEWLITEMQIDSGGYCSALDADTDKVEGKTYVWNLKELKSLLDASDYEIFAQKYSLNDAANFEGQWHLHSKIQNETLAQELELDLETLEQSLNKSQKICMHSRNLRPQPGRDGKILCSWNALMIRGMSLIGRRLDDPRYFESAIKSAEFIHKNLWIDQRLIATYKDGKVQHMAYLDDYAYLLQALLELLQAHWRKDFYDWAIQIADALLTHFEDDIGGFFFTSHDHEKLLYRSKTFADDAMPNGNAVVAQSLIQLSLLCGDNRYLDAAERTLRCASQEVNEQAIAHCSLLHALEDFLNPGIVVILRGTTEKLKEWKTISDQAYLPRFYCLAIPDTNEHPDLIPEPLQDKKPQGDICAYICEGTHCKPAVTDIKEYQHFIASLT